MWERVFPVGTSSKELTSRCRRQNRCGFNHWVGKIPWRREQATHFSILAWRIPRTDEPGGLQSIRSRRVDHDWSNLACMHRWEYWHPRLFSTFSWIIYMLPNVLFFFSHSIYTTMHHAVSSWTIYWPFSSQHVHSLFYQACRLPWNFDFTMNKWIHW